MGHFFNPPPAPIIGATAAQPYGQPKLPPAITAVPVNNPPFTNPSYTPQFIAENAFIAQPDPWPYVFLDKSTGGQPYGPGTFFTTGAVVVVAQTPYTNQWMANVIQSWFGPDPAPTLPGKLNPSITAVPVNNPPPNPDFLAAIISTVQSWQPGDPFPTQPRNFDATVTPAIVVNNPPFGNRVGNFVYPIPQIEFLFGLEGILPSGPASAPTLNPYVNPWLSAILAAWQPPDPPPSLPGKLNPSITAVPVNNPPFGSRTQVPNILAGWQPPDPVPTIPGKLSPGIPGQSVDNPPRLLRRGDFYPVADPIIQPQRYYPQAFIAPVSTQNPFVETWLSGVLSAWQASDPQPTLPRNLNPFFTAVPVNNPPFGARYPFQPYPAADVFAQPQRYVPQVTTVVTTQGSYANYWLATVLQSWQPADPQPTVPKPSAALPGWSVDNPPGAEGQLIISWLPDISYPQSQTYIVQPAAAAVVNNPPFSYAGRTAWMADVAFRAWLPPDPLPTLSGKLNPATLAVAVNNPPFSYAGRAAWLATLVVNTWQPPDPLPTLSGKLNPSALAVPVNNPPFSYAGRSELANILNQWQFPPPQPTPSVPPPQVQPGPPPPPITAEFTVSGPDVSVYLQEFFYDVSYTDAPITKRTV